MGRFEDLLAQARAGDQTALDSLATEFSGTALRDQADKASTLEAEVTKLREPAKRGKFVETIAGLPDELKEVLTFDEVKNMALDEISVEALKTAAEAKVSARNQVLIDAAQAAGFDTVEAFQTAMESVKQGQRQTLAAAEAAAGGVASGTGGGGTGGASEDDDFKTAKADYDNARKRGATEDIALGEFIETRLTQQAPAKP